jgi:hypothetical protein
MHQRQIRRRCCPAAGRVMIMKGRPGDVLRALKALRGRGRVRDD